MRSCLRPWPAALVTTSLDRTNATDGDLDILLQPCVGSRCEHALTFKASAIFAWAGARVESPRSATVTESSCRTAGGTVVLLLVDGLANSGPFSSSTRARPAEPAIAAFCWLVVLSLDTPARSLASHEHGNPATERIGRTPIEAPLGLAISDHQEAFVVTRVTSSWAT